jgi:hypothetical protein
MSDKMRWYTMAFWIFLTLSVSHFALAAPVAVGEIAEARSNPVEVLNDAMTGWEKRMDPEGKDQLSTNDVHLPDGVPGPGNAPGFVQEGVDAEGVKEKSVRLWGWGWDPSIFPAMPNWEELASGGQAGKAGKGPDASHNNPPNNPPKEEPNGGGGGGGDHAMASSQVSAENISPGPQPEHPATPDFMTSLKNWFFKGPGDAPKVFRPRNSGSGTVSTPKGVSGNR